MDKKAIIKNLSTLKTMYKNQGEIVLSIKAINQIIKALKAV